MQLQDINDKTIEGQLLMAAIAILCLPDKEYIHTEQTPDEVITTLMRSAKIMKYVPIDSSKSVSLNNGYARISKARSGFSVVLKGVNGEILTTSETVKQHGAALQSIKGMLTVFNSDAVMVADFSELQERFYEVTPRTEIPAYSATENEINNAAVDAGLLDKKEGGAI